MDFRDKGFRERIGYDSLPSYWQAYVEDRAHEADVDFATALSPSFTSVSGFERRLDTIVDLQVKLYESRRAGNTPAP